MIEFCFWKLCFFFGESALFRQFESMRAVSTQEQLTNHGHLLHLRDTGARLAMTN